MTRNRPGNGHKTGLEPSPRPPFSSQRPRLPACPREDLHVMWCGDTEPGPGTTPTRQRTCPLAGALRVTKPGRDISEDK